MLCLNFWVDIYGVEGGIRELKIEIGGMKRGVRRVLDYMDDIRTKRKTGPLSSVFDRLEAAADDYDRLHITGGWGEQDNREIGRDQLWRALPTHMVEKIHTLNSLRPDGHLVRAYKTWIGLSEWTLVE